MHFNFLPCLFTSQRLGWIKHQFKLLMTACNDKSDTWAEAYGEGRRSLPKMEIATCVGRKGKQEKRMKAKRCLCKSWTSCYHQEEPKAPSRKRSSYAWICHCSSCFPIKEMGKGKDNYFLVEKHYMTKKTKVTLPHSIVFTFSHFLTAMLGQ